MRPFSFAKTSTLNDNLQLGIITSLVFTTDELGQPTTSKSGLYNVQLSHTLRTLENVAAVQDSYNYNSNTGIIRLYDKDEPVLVAKMADGRYLIIGSALIADTNGDAPLPRVGSFGKPLSPGELYIGGVSKKAPVERTSYLHFDKVGNIDMSSNDSYIRFTNASGMISVRCARHEVFTATGFESWGPHGMVGTMVPAGVPKPGKWRRLVRSISSNNHTPFVYTEAGALGLSAFGAIADITYPLYMHNINNAAVVRGTMGGTYSITAGMQPAGDSLLKYSATTFAAVKVLAPLEVELDPITLSTTVRGPLVNIKGGLTGTEGLVNINALTINTIATGAINLTSTGAVAITGNAVTINAPATILNGNVVINGTLTVTGPMTTLTGTLNAGYVNASNLVRFY
tara:strand:- start:795 stop:1991 length:1197 start_codon:yes stop_codon:yes gene_type:complete